MTEKKQDEHSQDEIVEEKNGGKKQGEHSQDEIVEEKNGGKKQGDITVTKSTITPTNTGSEAPPAGHFFADKNSFK